MLRINPDGSTTSHPLILSESDPEDDTLEDLDDTDDEPGERDTPEGWSPSETDDDLDPEDEPEDEEEDEHETCEHGFGLDEDCPDCDGEDEDDELDDLDSAFDDEDEDIEDDIVEMR